MKFGIIVVVVIILSALAAQLLLADPGYVAIRIRGWTLETSVPVLVGALFFLIFALWAMKKLWQAPRRIGEAAGRIRAGRAGQKLTAGMIEASITRIRSMP